MLKSAPALVKCREDDEFIANFEKMMSEDIQTRKTDNIKVPNMDVAVPMHLKGPTVDKGGRGMGAWQWVCDAYCNQGLVVTTIMRLLEGL